jgi:acyl dehydratase
LTVRQPCADVCEQSGGGTMRRFKSIEEMQAAVGQELTPSTWLRVTQDRIDAFARVTGDDQWIHVDVERAAREMPEGRTIAHGFLTLSLIPVMRRDIWLLESAARGINYGLERARFPAPVLVGDRIRLRQTLVSVEPFGSGFKLRFQSVVDIEGGEKPACVADMLALVYEQ